jgi:diguanylate cyclase (GGDEF)-like protein
MATQPSVPGEDSKQAHRFRRYLMGVGSSLLVIVLMHVLYVRGEFELSGYVYCAAAMFFFFVLFYALFRSGLNRLALDPSLTVPQVLSAILVLNFAMFHASSDARALFQLILLMSFLFGVFRLETRQLLMVSTFAMAAYGVMLACLAQFRAGEFDPSLEYLRWGVLSAILLWFAMMGGYMSRLRKELAHSKTELEVAMQTIQDMAIRDELTGVYNRRYLMSVLANQQLRSARTGEAFCVAVVDLDHFKAVNDSHGHAGGDEVLRCFSSRAVRDLRAMDQFGRYGGEEFMLVMSQTTLEAGKAGAERLRRNTEAIRVPGFDESFRLTVSIGVAQYRPDESVDETVRRADAAMYRAKEGGRNRVECDAG